MAVPDQRPTDVLAVEAEPDPAGGGQDHVDSAERENVSCPHFVHTFDKVFAWIRLCARAHNAEHLKDTMLDACEIAGGTGFRLEILTKIVNGELQVPHRTTMQKWTLKLDLAVMHWRRSRLGKEGRVFRHLGADASPQAGYNFLCAREESMFFDEPSCHSGSD